ncbi:MAG TPA: carboxypeptidase-like regulatory domain-containing protein [Rhizomicrobium sp.]|nr:carboxypeptidase-like regulatory domain-containing protein [Rhizomicrobium sp.]
MATKHGIGAAILLSGTALFLSWPPVAAQSPKVAIDTHSIGGVVAGPRGPEAGVWVIAETKDLPTKYAKIVVTDDAGRYVLPDLPAASYSIWVRGYGLVDSQKVQTRPGQTLDLKAVLAPDAKAAAQYYPAIYWYSMLKIPVKSEFPGTGPKPGGNGMANKMQSQEQWLDLVKTDGCFTCHQLGDAATRNIEKSLGQFESSAAAWEHRIQVGQAGNNMIGSINRFDTQRALALFGDWSERIAAGELPFAKPQRPQGRERNIVITLWDWNTPKAYLHDENSTDRRNPTVNAYGKIYGSPEESSDFIPVLDPVKHEKSEVKALVLDPDTPNSKDNDIPNPSPYWGREAIWNSQTTIHNPMFDAKGRVWFTTRVRAPDNAPSFCKEGSSHPSAKLFPVKTSGRQLAVYDPATKVFTPIDTCYATHHLQFDAQDRVWTSGGGPVVGWFDTKIWDATHDAQKAQGWTALVVDTNGNGKRDAYTEPGEPMDPKKDMRINAGFYGVAPNPSDGSIWGSSVGFPGAIVRLSLGAHPPETTLAEVYQPPIDDPKAPVHGYSPRGMDIDHNGVVWTVLASGHFASFDRRKCKGPLNGPNATGRQCPEGWTLYPFPGPQFRDVKDSGSAEASYYAWVDQYDTFGLGKNVPIATGNASDALFALVNGKYMTLRVPYPMGFYAKGLDGRIDDAKVGWKGRGLWATYGTRTPQHMEGGKGTTSKVVHIQLRPDPLAL